MWKPPACAPIYLESVEHFLRQFTKTPILDDLKPLIIPCEKLKRVQIRSLLTSFRNYFFFDLPAICDYARLTDPQSAETKHLEQLESLAHYLIASTRDYCIIIEVDHVRLFTSRRFFASFSRGKEST